MSLELPQRDQQEDAGHTQMGEQTESQTSTVAAPSELETPATSQAPSETDSTHPTTPSSTLPQHPGSQSQTPVVSGHKRATTKPAVPLVPVTPIVANQPLEQKPQTASAQLPADKGVSEEEPKSASKEVTQAQEEDAAPTSVSAKVASPPKAAPKSWADLVRTKSANASAAPVSLLADGLTPNNVLGLSNAGSLAEVLRSFDVDSESKTSFIEPRGLVNTGNMCYMNSVSRRSVFL